MQQAREANGLDALDRLTRLQAVTAAYSEALTDLQVAQVTVTQATAAVGAIAGAVRLLSHDGRELVTVDAMGYTEGALAPGGCALVAESLPSAEAMARGEAIWLGSPAAILERYPIYAELYMQNREQATGIVPLVADRRSMGVLALGFGEPHEFGPEEAAFITALARQCAQGLERARLFTAERTARRQAEQAQQRLELLAEAGVLLATSLDYELTLQNVARLALPELADWCFFEVLTERGLVQRVAVECINPEKIELAAGLKQFPTRLDGGAGAAASVASGRSQLMADLPDSFIDAVAQEEEHARLLRQAGIHSVMFVPLVARGRTIGVLGFALAESARSYTPEDLALAEELGRRAAFAVDNARLYRQTQETLRIRDDFLASVSHDLKTPLTTIKGFAQLLRRWVSRLDVPQQPQILDGLTNIDAVTGKMTAQVGELLDLTRLQTGRPLDLTRNPTDLVELARRASDEHQRSSNQHRLHVKAAVESLVGNWDGPRLERVLANLLSNAIKYSPEGGAIELSVFSWSEEGAEWAVLSVSDEGIGIPPADLPYIFDRFYRGANAIGKMWGSGIGLTGARQIVEQHGGTISATNNSPGGSTFSVRLPLAVDTTPAAVAAG